MILLYNTLLLGTLLVCAPLWIPWVLVSPRLRRRFFERLLPLRRSRSDRRGAVWVHAASVGEVEAAAPLIEALLERGVSVLATTLSVSGREHLSSRLPGLRVRLAPLDLPGLVQVSLRRARIRVLVLVETEIWPNLIWAARGAGSEVLVVSGRLSDSSFPLYRRLRPLFRAVLRRVHRVAARSEEDRARFLALGVPPERLILGGDLKLDRPAAPPARAELLDALGPGPFLVGGSTHPGEEEALLAAWRELRGGPAPQLRLILVPRHPERVAQVVDTVRRQGARVGLRSQGAAEAEVVVVDTLGELSTIYGLADLVFGGGTLAPVGGHNLIEPVQAGRVVVHGPHTQNQRSHERLLEPLGVLHRIERGAELAPVLADLWADPERNAPAADASRSLEAHRGAVARACGLILELLSTGSRNDA